MRILRSTVCWLFLVLFLFTVSASYVSLQMQTKGAVERNVVLKEVLNSLFAKNEANVQIHHAISSHIIAMNHAAH